MTHIEEIINLIQNNEDLIDFDYNGVKDLIIIQGKLFKDIIKFTSSINDKNINTKELIKSATRSALTLHNQELIIVKQERIVIKIITNIKRTSIDENNPTIANRCNGYSVDEIENLYNNYFDEESISDFTEDVSYDVFKYLFIRKHLTNDNYEKNIYPIIIKLIIDKLDDFHVDIDLKKGFAGYILRVNFITVFTYIAEDILESIAYRDEFLMNWIKYYHGQVVVDGNQRYEAPSLINSEGQKYNPSAIFGTVAMWFKTNEKVITLTKRLHDSKQKLSVLKIENLSPRAYKHELILERQEFEKDISGINERLEELLDERIFVKDNNLKFEINDEIKELRQLVREDKAELNEINTEITSIDTDTSRSLEENIIRIQKNLELEKSIIKQNTKLYTSIKSALIKALTSKRKPIDK